MVIHEQYYFWKLAADLMIHHDFHLIQVDEKNREIWLEKRYGRKTHIIRLYHHTFDWANHLKRDIAFVIERMKRIKQMLVGRDITVQNVYIAAFPPVDHWEDLKGNIQVKDQKNFLIQTYYLDGEARQEEMNRLYQNLGLDVPVIQVPQEDREIERQVHDLKQQMMFKHEQFKKETSSIFNYGKPNVTYLLLTVNIFIFFLLETSGGSTNTLNLINWGAKYNPYILEGEWWRILSSMFLHIGLLHIMMNMFALYYLGNAVERMYGSVKFFMIYFLAGIIGGVASFATNDSVAAGASGAIFGLFGALLFFGLMNKRVFFRTMGKNILFIIGLNIILGFSVPQIDNGAHLGGLVGGFIASAMVQLPKQKAPLVQGSSLVIYLGLLGLLIYFGFSQTFVHHDSRIHLMIASDYIEAEQYDDAILITTYALKRESFENAYFYYVRSLAYMNENKRNLAIEDLNEAVQIRPSFHEAHYELAVLHQQEGDINLALRHAEEAVTLDPDNSMYQKLKNELLKLRDSLQ